MDIQAPIGGLDENLGFADQPNGTTRRAQNVRGIDPVTGRVRLSQRSGTSQVISNHATANGSNPIMALDQVTYSQSTLDYTKSESGAPLEIPVSAIEWSAPSSTGASATNVKIDSQGNRYVLDEKNSITKFNSKGVVAQSWNVPVGDPQAICRALAIDEFDNIYVGHTEGGDQNKAAIWKYSQKPEINEGKPKQVATLEWEFVTKKYVAAIRVKLGTMAVAMNDNLQWKSRVYRFGGLTGGLPTLLWSSSAPYPMRGIDMMPSGNVVCCSPTNSARATNPLDPNVGFVTDEGTWTPLNLTDAQKRIWSWYDAERIDGGKKRYDPWLQKGAADVDQYEQGDEIFVWTDLSGNGRNLYADYIYQNDGNVFTDASKQNRGPTYNEKGLAGKPTVHFKGGEVGSDAGNQSMVSGANVDFSHTHRDQQLTMLPAYNQTGGTDYDGMFCVFVVCKGNVNATSTKTGAQALFAQRSANTAANDRGISFNYGLTNPTPAGAPSVWTAAVSSGQVSVYDYSSSAVVTNPPEYSGYAGAPIILTWLCDGAGGSLGAATSTASIFRVNGTKVGDRWISGSVLAGIKETILAGRQGTTNHWAVNTEFWGGDIAEIIVLNRYKTADTDPSGFVLSHPTSTYAGTTYAPAGTATPTEMEQIEGYLAHKWGIKANLDANHPYVSNAPLPTATSVDVNGLNTTNATVAEYRSADGALVRYENCTFGTDYNDSMGMDVVVAVPWFNVYTGKKEEKDSNCYIWSCGTSGTASGVTMLYPSVLSTGTANSRYSVSETVSYNEHVDTWPRIDTDWYGNGYFPLHSDGSGQPGVLVYKLSASPACTLLGQFFSSSTAGDRQGGICVAALKVPVPQADSDLASSPPRSEYFTAGYAVNTYGGGASSASQVQNVRMFTTAVNNDTPRAHVRVAVAGGYLAKYTTSWTTSFSGSSPLSNPVLTVPSGSYKPFYVLIPTQDKLWMADGVQYRVFDPKLDIVKEWKASSAGEMPKRCRLGCLWRGRIVLARSEDDPQNWYMSKVGDPENWDYFPPVVTSDMAIAGNNALAGKVPDIVNAVIPYNDDTIIFGGDSTIWQLYGDPADINSPGQMTQVSDITGIAFGDSWAKDPEGIIYFFGSRGGVYAMAPGQIPVSLSRDRIERRLLDVALGTYRPRLVWNDEDDALHVFLVPWTGALSNTVVEHYVWQRKTKSWWVDKFSNTGAQITAAYVSDGDAVGDRKLILGRTDGRIVKWDRSAKSDSGTTNGATDAIHSAVLIGPLAPEEEDNEYRFSRFNAVLSPSQNGCYYRLWATDTPEPPINSATGVFSDDPSQIAKETGLLVPGRNPAKMDRMRGSYCFLELGLARAGERWAVESLSIDAAEAGRKRRAGV